MFKMKSSAISTDSRPGHGVDTDMRRPASPDLESSARRDELTIGFLAPRKRKVEDTEDREACRVVGSFDGKRLKMRGSACHTRKWTKESRTLHNELSAHLLEIIPTQFPMIETACAKDVRKVFGPTSKITRSCCLLSASASTLTSDQVLCAASLFAFTTPPLDSSRMQRPNRQWLLRSRQSNFFLSASVMILSIGKRLLASVYGIE